MHVALTLSSLVYVVTSIGKTLYASSLAKEDEEHKLVREAVHHVWVTFVRGRRRTGEWSDDCRAEARERALAYVRRNRSRMCSCFGASRARLVSWINDAVACNKVSAVSVSATTRPASRRRGDRASCTGGGYRVGDGGRTNSTVAVAVGVGTGYVAPL